jgi:hypothetical protein
MNMHEDEVAAREYLYCRLVGGEFAGNIYAIAAGTDRIEIPVMGTPRIGDNQIRSSFSVAEYRRSRASACDFENAGPKGVR